MRDNHPQQKKPSFTVSEREVAYFEKNYPLHHAVLKDMIQRGEATITNDNGGVSS